MSIEKAIEKYLRLIKTEHFAKYEKDFARGLQIGLNNGYYRGLSEPAMVSEIEGIINNLQGLSVSANGCKISTKSIFIHGNRSRVEFQYYDQKVKRELGDLIFILSIIHNEQKYFEKFTISQFKKDKDRLRWDLSDKEQLYLLSRFPSFRGVKGSIIPTKEFNLPNYSGCLGSYHFLYRPGDFAFVGASRLETAIGHRTSLGISDIFKLWEQSDCYSHLFDWLSTQELIYCWYKIHRHRSHWGAIPFCPPFFIGILGFSRYASNIYDFVDKYLRGYVGELAYSEIGIYNTPALTFIREMLSSIGIKAKKEKRTEVIEFVDEYFKYKYGSNEDGMGEDLAFDYEGGGIGIIYTSINLGEGE